MITTFGTIRDYVRAAVQDSGSPIPIYSDNALNSQIRFSLLQHEWEAKTDEPEQITTELSNKDKLVITLEIAIRLLSGRPDDFTYRSPVLTVARRNQVRKLLDHLQDVLDEVKNDGGRFAIATETDITAFLKSLERYLDEYTNATN